MRAARLGAVAAATGLLVSLGATAPAVAATPESSTLKAPKGTGTVVSQWSGTIDAPSVGVLVGSDVHTLTVTLPGKAAKYLKKRDAVLQIEMSWENTTPLDDLDLYVYDEAGTETRYQLTERSLGIWHGRLPGIEPGQRYAYRADGPWDPENGYRFNVEKVLLDPYGLATSGTIANEPALFGYDWDDPTQKDAADSAPVTGRSVVVGHPVGCRADARWPWCILGMCQRG